MRLHRQYEREAAELEHDARLAATAPVLRRHVVLVLVDRLDRSAARAIQYARTLAPDELRAVHIAADLDRAEALADDWARLGLSRLTLELVDCPDRRLPQALVEVVSEALAGGDTEVSVLLPRRCYRRLWHRLLHDRTADRLAGAARRAPPRQRHLRPVPPGPMNRRRRVADPGPGDGPGPVGAGPAEGRGAHAWNARWSTPPAASASSSSAGAGWPASTPARVLAVEGMAGSYHDRLAILNPDYEILPP